MNKSDLIRIAAKQSGIPQHTTAAALDAALNIIKQALADGNTVRLHGLGVLKPYTRKTRMMYSVNTGKHQQTEPTMQISFKASRQFKDRMNNRMISNNPQA